MFTLPATQAEALLDGGALSARMSNGRYWRLRRNGATKRWVTRPAEFRIPVKAGLRACGYITERSGFAHAPGADFLISTL